MKEKIQFEESLPGFRKGVTKESLLKGMSKEDWVFLDKCKAAEDLQANGFAYNAFIKSDQAFQEHKRILTQIEKTVIEALMANHEIIKNEVDIKNNVTENSKGEPISAEALKLINLEKDRQIRQGLDLLAPQFSKLFTFVGKLGLDRKAYFSQEDFDEFTKNIVRQLENTRYKLF